MILSITILSVLVGVLGIVTFLHLRVIAELKMEVSRTATKRQIHARKEAHRR